MAKVKYGAMVTDARGSIDGVVYSKNRYGGYVRVKVSPTQPRTESQTLVRTSFGGNSKDYSTLLTDAQRTSWANFAASFPRTDVFGNSQILSGLAMYQSINRILAQVGVAALLDPPVDLSVTALTSVVLSGSAAAEGADKVCTAASWLAGVATLTSALHGLIAGDVVHVSGFGPSGWNGFFTITVAAANTIDFSLPNDPGAATTFGKFNLVNSVLNVAFGATPLAANHVLYVEATPRINQGVNFFDSALRFIGYSAGADASPTDFIAEYLTKFASLTSGTKVGARVATVNTDNGAISPGTKISAIMG